MRTYTVCCSVVAHAVAACVLFLAPVLATAELPEPRRATEFLQVTAAMPVAPPAVRVRNTPPRVSPDAAPLAAPDGFTPEMPGAPSPGDIEPVPGMGVVDTGQPIAFTPAPPPAAPFEPRPQAPIRVGGSISLPAKVMHVAPVYPPLARSARVSGVVILEVVIDEHGAVRDVQILRSIPLLDRAAADAVSQWRFTPTLLNGQPVPVVMTVTVSFTLN
jgi:periplasmic protein TonB